MKIRIGTRGSPLALEQTNRFIRQLIHLSICSIDDVTIVPIKTTGDLVKDRPLYEIGGKALFSKEIESALLRDEIDCAVHSLKDLESILSDDVMVAAVLERGDPRDCLVSQGGVNLKNLPRGAKVGTSSPRREAQLKMLRPDLVISPIRGNVQTRLTQVKEGKFDATLLAYAGLERLGLESAACEVFEPEDFLPAAGQGTIAIQIRQDNRILQERLSPLNHRQTARCALAEKEVLRFIEGDCRTPIAAFAAEDKHGNLQLRAKFWRLGLYSTAQETGEDPVQLAKCVAQKLLE